MIWRQVVAGALLSTALSLSPSAEPPETPKPKDAAALARAYVDAWQPALGAIVAEERYRQVLTQWDGLGSQEAERVLVSDVLLVQAPHSEVWMLFRDVMTMDGKPVRDREQRFEALFVRPEREIIPSARRIASESARFNLGSVARDLNTPAAALIFLREPFIDATKWQKMVRDEVDGRPAWKLSFEQKKAPFAIRTATGRPQPAAGHVWLEPGSARIMRTMLDVWNASTPSEPRTHVVVVSHFGSVSGLDVAVPLRMEEQYHVYAKRGGRLFERLEAEARYSNHRRFQTGARLVE